MFNTKNHVLELLSIVGTSLALWGCGNTSNGSGGGSGRDRMTAMIGNVPFEADTVLAAGNDAVNPTFAHLLIEGRTEEDANGQADYIHINFSYFPEGPSTYLGGFNGDQGRNLTIGWALLTTDGTSGGGYSGSVTITTLTSERVEGTFENHAAQTTTGELVDLANGTFSAALELMTGS